MNYYFLLEDEKSFLQVLPKWFEYMGFNCERVPDMEQMQKQQYILQSGQGVTQLITRVLFQTIDTIIEKNNIIDKLVIILDAEELDIEDRKKQVYDMIYEKYGITELKFDVHVYVCNHCFESWLLGCEGLYPEEEVEMSSFFYPYYTHYNIRTCDPENMKVPLELNGKETIAKYHFHYLHELLRYKKIRYSKHHTKEVATQEYFNGIKKRVIQTTHVRSFNEFYEFIISQGTSKI